MKLLGNGERVLARLLDRILMDGFPDERDDPADHEKRNPNPEEQPANVAREISERVRMCGRMSIVGIREAAVQAPVA